MRFSTWVKSISITEQDGIPAYRLALPDAVEAKQRRRNFRVPVDADAGVRLRIRDPEGNKLLCTVLNMSLAGACFSCQGNLSEHLRTTPVLRNCTLSIPGVGDIGCDLEVRSFEFRRQPYRYTVVGVLLDGLNSGASSCSNSTW